MNMLLVAINAKYIHSNLAIYSLRAYAGRHKDEIGLAEYTVNQKSEEILAGIWKKKPDVLFFSCYIWNYEYVREIAAEFHRLAPHVPIWAGGPEASYEIGRFFAENPAVCGVMYGEGEATFAELSDYYCGGTGCLSEICGIAFRPGACGDEEPAQACVEADPGASCADGGSNGNSGGADGPDCGNDRAREGKMPGGAADGACAFVKTAPREPLDFSSVPFAYEDMKEFENRIVYYESSRGCPFSCSYCLSSLDRSARFRDAGLVEQELAFFMERRVRQVKFVDRTFNCSREHARRIWKFIRDRDTGHTSFHFEIAADLLEEEEFSLLESFRPGLAQLEIGVQSVHEKTLDAVGRKTSLPKIKYAARRLLASGNLHLHLDLIAGLPYEDFEQFAQSFREIYALKPHQLQLGFLKLLKGSGLRERREEYGMLCQERPPYEVRKTKWLSYDDFLRIKLAEEMLEAYYNSGQFEVTMKLADASYPDSFRFFLSLGQFYEKKGYLCRSHSRIRRCEILLEFLASDGRMDVEMVKESLLYDLYYRENMKSRPAWARDLSEFKEASRAFCKNRTQSHIEPFFYRFPKKRERSVTKLPQREREPVYVLFEYGRRDVLDHQAETTEYESREVEERCRKERKRF